MNDIERFRRRRARRLDARGIRAEHFDFNDNHDKLGRFAPKTGGSTKTAEEMTKADIVVRGPKGSKKYIVDYMKAHPEARKQIRSDAKKYSDALRRVKEFQKDHPDIGPGTYSMSTGKPVDINDGYCVTFHQNHEIGNEFG